MGEKTLIDGLINTGVLGVVLAWFMFRLERTMQEMARAIDRSSRAVLLAILSIEDMTPGLRDQVDHLLKEVDRAHDGS